MRRVFEGAVVSDKSDKTVIVRVERRYKHPLYKKFVSKFKKYAAHDEENHFKKGDVIFIRESRPYSKTKSWEVVMDLGKKNAF